MSVGYVVLKIELDAIRNFLEHVDREAGVEIQELFERHDADEFEGNLDDFDNALYSPLMRQEIAARAVYHELNALIERELYSSAYSPWLASTKHPGPKLLDFNNLTEDSMRTLKTVQDLPFGKIVSLIEDNHQTSIKDLDGGAAFLEMRKMVNAFKHRHGWIDFRKEASKQASFMKRYKADIEQAYQAIDDAYIFIIALWKATGSASSLT